MSFLRTAATFLTAAFLAATGAQAGPTKADGWVSTPRGQVHVQFSVFGPCRSFPFGTPGTCVGILVLRSADHPKPEIVPLRYPATILALLVDKRMQFMWQPLIDWAGPTLEPLRDRTIAQLRDAYSKGYPMFAYDGRQADSLIGPRVQALGELTDYLSAVGRTDEAEELLRDSLSKMAPKADTSASALEWELVALRIASARFSQGDPSGAAAEYALIETTLGGSPYAANATVNRAAILVRSKEYAAALSAIDSAIAKVGVPLDHKSKVYVTPGSNRRFALIRGCALQGLGRISEAQAALQPLLADTPDHEIANSLDVTPDLVKRKAAICMGDIEGLKKQVAADLRDEFILTDGLVFQSGYVPVVDKAAWDAVRSDPELEAIANQRMRALPPELAAALKWDSASK